MNNLIKLTHVEDKRIMCVRKTDVVMLEENTYETWREDEKYEKPCTTVYLSEDKKDWMWVEESVDTIMEMMKDE